MRTSIPAAVLLALLPALSSAEAHKFTPTAGVATFAVRAPVLTIEPGDTVETETFSKPGDYYNPAAPGPWPGEVGPFHIKGAEPGDTLVIPTQEGGAGGFTFPSGITQSSGSGWYLKLRDGTRMTWITPCSGSRPCAAMVRRARCCSTRAARRSARS